jgi:4-amino-4-deoxy-L-arabinose transferase-like glycosyltransferase
MIVLGLGLGLLIWRMAHESFGRAPGLIALSVFAFTPDFLAHAPLVATDFPVATFFFGHVYFLFRSLRRPGGVPVVLAGLFLGAALATKVSALVLALATPLIILAYVFGPRWTRTAPPAEARARRRQGAWIAVSCVVLSLAVLWATYGFRYAAVGADGASYYDWTKVSAETSAAAQAVRFARDVHVVPEPYAYGFLYVLSQSEHRPGFLAGTVSDSGWWYYFFVTFLLKTPIPLILAILAAAVSMPRRLREGSWPHLVLALPILVYGAVVVATTVNIGHRHLLPLYPLLIVLAAEAASRAMVSRRRVAVAAALGGWLAVGTAWVHPHHLAYFNELIGGPGNGWRYLADSNLEWGQDLPALKRWMERAGVRHVWLRYFGSDLPERYGIAYEPLPSFLRLRRPFPEPLPRDDEVIAISATNLHGVYLRDPQWQDFTRSLQRRRKPRAMIGYSILVF